MTEKLAMWKDCVTARLKGQQKLLFFVTCGVFCAGLFGSLFWVLTPTPDSSKTSKKAYRSKSKKVDLSTTATGERQQEIWVERIQNTHDTMNKRLNQLEDLLKTLVNTRLQETAQGQESDRSGSISPTSLTGIPTDEVTDLRAELSTIHHEKKPTPESVSSPVQGIETPGMSLGSFKKQEIRKITFQLSPVNSHTVGKSVDHYVPAGTFVRGVLTNGVVASTTVGASANPQPVHIQLTHLGNLPRRFKADIKKCFLIGAAYGDLPSERVFVRLEKFSCVERRTGEVMEAAVDGYVSGEDGATGIRGLIVDRSGPAMRNAFIGGFVSGIGNFFAQQQNQPLSLAGNMAALNPLSASSMAKAGAAQGASAAMDKFADFYIKRAEQLQPVIEIEPGRQVDVVFKEGFDLNQTLYRRHLKQHNDHERRQTVSDAPSTSSWSSHE